MQCLCLGVLLLCGFVTWSGVTPRALNGLEVPLFVDQADQLAVAGSGDQLRTRSGLRKGGSISQGNADDDPDGPGLAISAAASIADWRLPATGFDLPSQAHLPTPARYRLPAPREPPTA